jgi:hypothetical protein
VTFTYAKRRASDDLERWHLVTDDGQHFRCLRRMRVRSTLVTQRSPNGERCDDCDSLVRIAVAHAEAKAIVATGQCPTCGDALKRNLSLAGWWQCAQLGAVGFRKDPSRPSCNFQCFTE